MALESWNGWRLRCRTHQDFSIYDVMSAVSSKSCSQMVSILQESSFFDTFVVLQNQHDTWTFLTFPEVRTPTSHAPWTNLRSQQVDSNMTWSGHIVISWYNGTVRRRYFVASTNSCGSTGSSPKPTSRLKSWLKTSDLWFMQCDMMWWNMCDRSKCNTFGTCSATPACQSFQSFCPPLSCCRCTSSCRQTEWCELKKLENRWFSTFWFGYA